MPEQAKTEEEKVAQVKTDDDLDAKLVESVQAKLDAINGNVDDTDGSNKDDDVTDDDDKQADDDKTDDDSTPGDKADDDTADDDSTPGDKTKDTDDTKGEDKTTKEVLLPDAYYRAAIHQGWKPDEIKEFFEANPEIAVKTLAKIHESTNKLSSEFARLGRISVKPADKTADSQTATETNVAKGVDITAIKDQYGDDSAVVKAFEIMQSRLDSIPTQTQQQKQDDYLQKIHDEEIAQQNPEMKATVNKFFTDPALKPYEDFYGAGKDAAKLTQEQNGHRFSMLEMADNIILGSQARGFVGGKAITAEEAMESAHLLVSEPVREKALRTELSTKIKKRAKGLTLKPTKTKTAVTVTDGKVTEEQLIERVTEKLQKVFH